MDKLPPLEFFVEGPGLYGGRDGSLMFISRTSVKPNTLLLFSDRLAVGFNIGAFTIPAND